MTKSEYIAKLKLRYDYLEDWRCDDIYEIAKRELLLTLNSSNASAITSDTQIPYVYEYTLLEAMNEIVDIGTMRNFTSYSENGWSWTRPKNGLQSINNIKSKVVIS